jgi:hypothetical protein
VNIAVLQTQYVALQKRLDAMETTLDEVKALLTEARGGWRVMMLLGGAAATVGGLVTWALNHLRFTP